MKSRIDFNAVDDLLNGIGHYTDLDEAERRAYRHELDRRGLGKRPQTVPPVLDFHPKPPPVDADAPCHGDARFTTYPVDLALTLKCRGCRLATWCEETVRPKRSGFDGIVAGVIYHNGRAVWPR